MYLLVISRSSKRKYPKYTKRKTKTFFNLKQNGMLELITVVALILLVRFWVNPHKKKKSSAAEKENISVKQNSESIVGKSTFVLSTSRHAQTKKRKSLSLILQKK